jgi:porin
MHAPGETDEDHSPVVLDLAYTSEVNGVLRGGNKRSARYLDNLDIVAEADLNGLIGWKGASALAYGLYNNGATFSPLVGDAQVTSNIETGTRAFRLYEAWLNQELGDRGSLRLGCTISIPSSTRSTPRASLLAAYTG